MTFTPSALAAPSVTRAVLELELNGTRKGDVIVLLMGDDVLVPETALRAAGVVHFGPGRYRYRGVDYYSLERSRPRLAFEINERDLVLQVIAPPTALESASLDLSERAPAGLWSSQEPSAFLTYAPSLTDFKTFRAFADSGFTAGPWRVTTSASYTQGQTPARLMSQLAYSDRRNIREVVLGDSYVSTGALGGSTLLGGLGVFRRFQLDPYFVRVPRLGYRGSVMAPSTVDVYVNNVLVRRASVAPGEFDLSGVAPASGAGNVRYVIRDPLSRQTDVVMDYYAASAALAPGVSEYAYAAGFERNRYGVDSFDYGRPLIMGFYRIGLNSHITSGVRAEASRTRVSGGTQLTLASAGGEIELASATSIDRDQVTSRGAAGLIGYYYQRGRVSLRAVLKGTSKYYTTSSLGPQSDRDLVEQSTSISLSVGSKTTLSTQLGVAFARDAGPHARSSVLCNRQLSRDVYLQLIAARNDRALGSSEYEGFATLSVILPESHTASLSAFASKSSSSLTASVTRPIVNRTGVGYQASGTLSETPSASASVQAQNRYLRADASYFYDGREQHTLIDASGSLVWVHDAGVFFSRPIYDAFAVVEVPKTPGATAYLNNQPIGKTDGSGQVLIPDLQAYYANRLRIDASDLPNDVQVDEGEVLVAPPPHGGARVVFGSRRLQAVRGRLAPIGVSLQQLRYGEVVVKAGGQTYSSPIGERGEFEFEGLPSGVWPAEARGDGGACQLEIPIPVEGLSIERLGAVSCFAPGAQP